MRFLHYNKIKTKKHTARAAVSIERNAFTVMN